MLSEVQIVKIKKTVDKKDTKLPMVFNALSDPGRFHIFKFLMKYHDVCVTDIANVFEISVPAASQQLRILEITGLIRKERMGQMICYTIKDDDQVVKSLIKLFKEKVVKNNF